MTLYHATCAEPPTNSANGQDGAARAVVWKAFQVARLAALEETATLESSLSPDSRPRPGLHIRSSALASGRNAGSSLSSAATAGPAANQSRALDYTAMSSSASSSSSP